MKNKKQKKVISRRNAGLGDNLLSVAHAWYYAKSTNRSLTINWAPSMYLSNKSANAFPFFFEVPDEIEGVKVVIENQVGFLKRIVRQLPLHPYRYFLLALIAEATHKIFTAKTPAFLKKIMTSRKNWSIDLIKTGTDVHYNTLIFNNPFNFLAKETKPFFDNLKLKPEFQSLVDNFAQNHFDGKKIIGVHVKYYDKTMPVSNHTQHWIDPLMSLKIIKENIQQIIKSFDDKNYIIYLATDGKIVLEYLQENFSNVICFDKDYKKIEYTQGQHLKLNDEAVASTLAEMFLLAKSDVLYRYPPSGSWFSHYGSLYAKETIM